jgi:hypothetical protein
MFRSDQHRAHAAWAAAVAGANDYGVNKLAAVHRTGLLEAADHPAE